MESGQNISLLLAFSAGLFSFLSPCVLPLVPSYVSYITGLSFEDLTNTTERKDILRATVVNSLLFIAGFSFVFISLGASASYIGKLMVSYQELIRKIGGIIIIIFGLFIVGILKIRFLQVEKKLHIKAKPAGYVGSFLVGIGFAAGWTPCVGPILGSILLFASTSGSVLAGVKLLATYSIGLALPLFISAVAINSFLSYFKRFHSYIRAITIASGLLLVILGILVYINSLSIITAYLYKLGIGWDVY